MLGNLDTNTQIPDFIEPLHGWRSWQVNDQGQFISPQRKNVWEGGRLAWDGKCGCPARVATTIRKVAGAVAKELLAERLKNGELPKAPPIVCLCGINAYSSYEQITGSPYYKAGHAIGLVHMSGTVRQYEDGWRAEYARIARVWATDAKYADAVRAAADSCGAVYEGVATYDRDQAKAHAKRQGQHQLSSLVQAGKFSYEMSKAAPELVEEVAEKVGTKVLGFLDEIRESARQAREAREGGAGAGDVQAGTAGDKPGPFDQDADASGQG